MITLHLPWPPSTNTYWRNGYFMRGTRRVQAMMISAAGRDYRERIEHIIRASGLTNRRLKGVLSVGVVLYPPDRRIRDEDNYSKALYDALTHAGLWEDDSQVKHSERWMGGVYSGGLVVLQVRQSFDKPIPDWALLGAGNAGSQGLAAPRSHTERVGTTRTDAG